MFANFATAITSGAAITMALFYVMNLLIEMQPGAVVEPRQPMEVAWVRVPQPEDPPTLTPPIPERIAKPAPPPTPTSRTDAGEATLSVPRAAPPTPRATPVGQVGAWSDGPLVSMIKVQPVYPARAAQSGLEGYVVVEFDVRADGTVENARVIESSNQVFERSALNAAYRFRFKPRVVDGVAQASPGVRNLFRYEMEKL
jgi:protein TonB